MNFYSKGKWFLVSEVGEEDMMRGDMEKGEKLT